MEKKLVKMKKFHIVLEQIRSDFTDFWRASFSNKMSHQNKSSGFFQRIVMIFLLIQNG